MRQIQLIVIHCSATPNGDSLFRGSLGTPGHQTPVQAIDGWHKARGFRRGKLASARHNPELGHIGYHYVIQLDGAVATGRSPEEIGAHVAGYNAKSLGICLIGTDRFTTRQWETLAGLVAALQKACPEAAVVGHRDLSPDQNANGVVEPFERLKTCPGFDVAAWLAAGGPDPDHVFPPPSQEPA